jgi:hypothetical protein
VTTVETGRSLGTRTGDLTAWVLTPRGAILTVSMVLSIATWLVVRHIAPGASRRTRRGRQP